MMQIFGVIFLSLAAFLTILVLYCVGMAVVVHFSYIFVGLGILISDIVAIKIAHLLLYSE